MLFRSRHEQKWVKKKKKETSLYTQKGICFLFFLLSGKKKTPSRSLKSKHTKKKKAAPFTSYSVKLTHQTQKMVTAKQQKAKRKQGGFRYINNIYIYMCAFFFFLRRLQSPVIRVATSKEEQLRVHFQNNYPSPHHSLVLRYIVFLTLTKKKKKRSASTH